MNKLSILLMASLCLAPHAAHCAVDKVRNFVSVYHSGPSVQNVLFAGIGAASAIFSLRQPTRNDNVTITAMLGTLLTLPLMTDFYRIFTGQTILLEVAEQEGQSPSSEQKKSSFISGKMFWRTVGAGFLAALALPIYRLQWSPAARPSVREA